jgi:hypothetical protein
MRQHHNLALRSAYQLPYTLWNLQEGQESCSNHRGGSFKNSSCAAAGCCYSRTATRIS